MRIIFATLTLAALSGTVAFAADAAAGKTAYDKSCKSCHGADGTPNPAIAKMMKVEMKDLKAADVQALSHDDLKKVITAGKGKMKAIPGAPADDIIAFMKTLKK